MAQKIIRPVENTEWFSKQTSPNVDVPPVGRTHVNGYQGHSPRIQADIVEDKRTADAKPEVLLRTYRQQIPDELTPDQLRLDRGFKPGGPTVKLTPREKHVVGYRGFQRGNKCKEDLGPLETTAELEIMLRQLSKGINGVTLANYDILREFPTTSVSQDSNCVKVPSASLKQGLQQFKRSQCAETSYADTYAKMNLGVGPFSGKGAAKKE